MGKGTGREGRRLPAVGVARQPRVYTLEDVQLPDLAAQRPVWVVVYRFDRGDNVRIFASRDAALVGASAIVLEWLTDQIPDARRRQRIIDMLVEERYEDAVVAFNALAETDTLEIKERELYV